MLQCTKCKEWKEESQFYADRRHTSGYQSACKDCSDEDGRKRREKWSILIGTKQPPPNSEFGDTGNKHEVLNA